ncbi:hypothetical protein [Nonomuraea wenchangensis]|uniref:hypothetical protein n=1 Tax=Nonomuraea wenchangensis TaxID=568860 RepID=UPI00331AFA86
MTEETQVPSTDGSRLLGPPRPESPENRGWNEWPTALLGAAHIALAAFVAGWAAGSVSRNDPVSSTASSTSTADPCSQVLHTATHLLDTAPATDELRRRTAFHFILDNSGCFDAEAIATTRAALDMLDKHAGG